MKGLAVSKLIEDRPQLLGAVQLANADGGGGESRLEHPWRRDRRQILAYPIVVEDRDERGNGNTAFLGSHPHRQLVAEVAHRRLAHARDAEMLAKRGRHLQIELVERNDAVDRLGAREVADGMDDVVAPEQVGHEKALVDALPRPVRVSVLFEREQQYATAQTLALAQKLVAFDVAGQAQDGGRSAAQLVALFIVPRQRASQRASAGPASAAARAATQAAARG